MEEVREVLGLTKDLSKEIKRMRTYFRDCMTEMNAIKEENKIMGRERKELRGRLGKLVTVEYKSEQLERTKEKNNVGISGLEIKDMK